MFKPYSLAALILCLPMVATAAGLNFQGARDLMHARADTLKMSAADIEQKRFNAKEARSLSGPKISLNAQQIEGRKDVHLGFDNPLAGLPGLPLPGRFSLDAHEDNSGPRASVDMMWPIYTGGAISAKQQASEAAVRESLAGQDKTRDELDTQLVQKYFGVQLARSIEKLRAEMLAQEERDLNRAKRFEKAGLIAKIERMGAEVNRDAAKRDFIASQSDREVAETELGELLREKEIGQLETPLFVTRNLPTLSYWTDLALNHNPIIKAIEAQNEQAQMGVKAAKSSFMPQVYLFGHYNMIDHYLTLRDRSARLGSARALADKAHDAKNQAQAEIRRVVEVAWLRSKDALEQYDLTVSSIELARENLRLRDKSFREGLSTVDDVNDARNKLIAAEVARRVVAYRFVVSYALLHAASGRMNDFLNVLNRPDIEFAS